MQIIENAVYMGAATPGQGGSAPVIDELNVTPSTSAQVITAPEGTDGYSPVNVAAVTSAIDANITAGNIKKDVEILGVTGSYEGQTPTGTMYIISNGTYNVADKAIANVQVPTSAPAHYIEKTVDANGKLTNSTSVIDLTGVTDVADYALYGAYYHNNDIINKDISFLNLKKVTGNSACSDLFEYSVITSCSFPELESLTGNFGFYHLCSNCTFLTSFSCPKLTQIISSSSNACGYILSDCGNLTSINFDSLKKINAQNCFNYGFMRAIKLLNIRFPAFNSQTFGSYINQFNYLLSGITGCTLHFPKNLDPQGGSTVISSLQGYPNFSGTNTVLAFDLPSTVLLTGANNIVYERSPKDDTVSALAWRKQDTGTAPNLTIDWTPFYTNTANDPSVGGTIYSDSACTTAVTTISSIA